MILMLECHLTVCICYTQNVVTRDLVKVHTKGTLLPFKGLDESSIETLVTI